eukprot:CAMPEP_0115244914 /NCGR_PEP_ID=MMETSP0270-20121206/40237_1 /TAXON_ID=71861 /ORGANISM="Scrippsiella trochoidea, Strain CCMP3099" /LENGTH=282 /DNA_ID=CAMNT_0002660073 /DNA_START=186 /DNA_END=1030 /DNA_ORIENTATION=-
MTHDIPQEVQQAWASVVGVFDAPAEADMVGERAEQEIAREEVSNAPAMLCKPLQECGKEEDCIEQSKHSGDQRCVESAAGADVDEGAVEVAEPLPSNLESAHAAAQQPIVEEDVCPAAKRERHLEHPSEVEPRHIAGPGGDMEARPQGLQKVLERVRLAGFSAEPDVAAGCEVSSSTSAPHRTADQESSAVIRDLCRQYQRGVCKRGARCIFSHDLAAGRPVGKAKTAPAGEAALSQEQQRQGERKESDAVPAHHRAVRPHIAGSSVFVHGGSSSWFAGELL